MFNVNYISKWTKGKYLSVKPSGYWNQTGRLVYGEKGHCWIQTKCQHTTVNYRSFQLNDWRAYKQATISAPFNLNCHKMLNHDSITLCRIDLSMNWFQLEAKKANPKRGRNLHHIFLCELSQTIPLAFLTTMSAFSVQCTSNCHITKKTIKSMAWTI